MSDDTEAADDELANTSQIFTAGEDGDVDLAFRDERVDETDHVSMPDVNEGVDVETTAEQSTDES